MPIAKPKNFYLLGVAEGEALFKALGLGVGLSLGVALAEAVTVGVGCKVGLGIIVVIGAGDGLDRVSTYLPLSHTK